MATWFVLPSCRASRQKIKSLTEQEESARARGAEEVEIS